MDREEQMRDAIGRAYAAAGLSLEEHHLESLAKVYAAWSQGADEGIVQRMERALVASLGAA
jgi:hypothetical protein